MLAHQQKDYFFKILAGKFAQQKHWAAANGGVTNGGLRGVWPPFLEIGRNRPFSPFFYLFALFRRVRSASGKFRKRRKKAFFLRYPQIYLHPHLLNPHLSENSRRLWLFPGSVRGFPRKTPGKSRENCRRISPEAPNATNSRISGTGKGKPAGNLWSTLPGPCPHLPCGVFFKSPVPAFSSFFFLFSEFAALQKQVPKRSRVNIAAPSGPPSEALFKRALHGPRLTGWQCLRSGVKLCHPFSRGFARQLEEDKRATTNMQHGLVFFFFSLQRSLTL